MFIADAHCDTLNGMLVKNQGFSGNGLQVSIENLEACKDGFLQFFAVFESPSFTIERQKADVDSMIRSFHDIAEQWDMKKVLSSSDVEPGRINALLSLEGLYFLEGEWSELDNLYDQGVRCLSPVWNPDNDFAGGAGGVSGVGLTEKGINLIRKAMELGIIVDVSHITDKGFNDIAEIAHEFNKPFVATHSNARKLCSHKRNLNDKMVKTLAASGGVMGINMFACFLNDVCSAGADDVVRHIEHICALVGTGHVGFGCDFDGIDREKSAIAGPVGINGILDTLLRMNYPEDDVRKIASGNFLRVIGEVLL